MLGLPGCAGGHPSHAVGNAVHVGVHADARAGRTRDCERGSRSCGPRREGPGGRPSPMAPHRRAARGEGAMPRGDSSPSCGRSPPGRSSGRSCPREGPRVREQTAQGKTGRSKPVLVTSSFVRSEIMVATRTRKGSLFSRATAETEGRSRPFREVSSPRDMALKIAAQGRGPGRFMRSLGKNRHFALTFSLAKTSSSTSPLLLSREKEISSMRSFSALSYSLRSRIGSSLILLR